MRDYFFNKPNLFLKRSVNELNMCRDLVQQAQILLRGTDEKGLNLFGNWETPMLLGVRILLQMYLILRADSAKENQIEKIKKMLIALHRLEKFSYNKLADWSDPKEFKDMLEERRREMKKIFEEEGEVYIPGGNKEHYIICKISRKKDEKTHKERYFHTKFNAAGSIQKDSAELTWGVHTVEFKGNVENLILRTFSNFYGKPYYPLPEETIEEMIEKTIEEASYLVSPQKIGNCTIRSTFEMLREGLSTTKSDASLFRDFFAFFVQSNVNDLIMEVDFFHFRLAIKHKKTMVHNYKIGDYSRFIQLVLDEAKILLKKPTLSLSDAHLKKLESMILRYLMKKKTFSLFEDDLMTTDIVIAAAKECIKQGYFISNRENRIDEQIDDNYQREANSFIIKLISKQIELELGKSISTDELIKLERYIHEHAFFDRYKACVYMSYRNLLRVSYHISKGLIDTDFFMIKENEIKIKDCAHLYQIKENHERIKQIYLSLLYSTNEDVGKDLCLSISAYEAFRKLNLYTVTLESEKDQFTLILKCILEDKLPNMKISSESVDIARDCLVEVVRSYEINSLIKLKRNIKNIQEKMNKEFIIHYAHSQRDFKQLDSHITISLMGNSSYISQLNKISAQFLDKIQAAATSEFSAQEKWHIISLLKKVLQNKDYSFLKLIKMSGQMFDDAIIDTILKYRENLDDSSEEVNEVFKKLFTRYIIESSRTFSPYFDLDDEAEENLRRLVENNKLSQLQRNSAFLKVVSHNSFDLANMLITQGVDINYKEKEVGCTALGEAISNKNRKMVQFLLDNKADIFLTTYFDFTPLMFAYHNESPEIIKLLENKDTVKKNQENFFKLVKGNIKYKTLSRERMIGKFLKSGIDINCRDEFGNTALIWAAWNKDLKMVNILLDSKADVNKRGDLVFGNKSPLRNSYEKGDYLIVKRLIEAGAKDTLEIFLMAVKRNLAHEDGMIRLFLESKAIDVDAVDQFDNSALSYAVFLGNSDIENLLKGYAKKTAFPIKNIEKVYFSAFEDLDFTLIENFFLKDSSLVSKINNGVSALNFSYKHNKIEMMEKLIKLKPADYKNVFIRAVQDGKKDIVEKFLNWSVSIETLTLPKDTALILAAKKGHTEIVRLLINRGANINYKAIYKPVTALKEAYLQNQIDVMEVLVKAKCADAKQVLAEAQAVGNTKLVRLFHSWGIINSEPAPTVMDSFSP